MAFVLPEMTQETTTTTGTGTYSLAGAVAGFRAFSNELSTGDTTLYTVYDSSSPPIYEINYGVWTTGSPATLSRVTLVKSSTGAPINWAASTKNVVAGVPGKIMQGLFDPAQTLGLVELSAVAPAAFDTIGPVQSFMRTFLAAANAAAARAALSAVIGTDVQAWDTDLDTIAGLAKTSGNVIRGNGSAWTSAVLAAADVSVASAVSPLSGSTVEAVLDSAGTLLAAGLSAYYTTGLQAITTGSVQSFTHSLGAAPKLVSAYLQCVSGEHGYAVGDQVRVGAESQTGNGSITVFASTTQVRYRVESGGEIYVNRIGSPSDDGASTQITNGNWNIVLQAWT